MNLAVLLFVLILGSVLQALLPPWPVTQAKAPVLLALVLFYALTRPRGQAFTAAVLAGFLQDANTEMPLGYTSLAFFLAAAVLCRFRDEMYVLHPITHILCGALAGGVVILLQGLMLVGFLRDPYFALDGYTILLRILGTAVLGGIVTPFAFSILRGLDRYLGYMDEREVPRWP